MPPLPLPSTPTQRTIRIVSDKLGQLFHAILPDSGREGSKNGGICVSWGKGGKGTLSLYIYISLRAWRSVYFLQGNPPSSFLTFTYHDDSMGDQNALEVLFIMGGNDKMVQVIVKGLGLNIDPLGRVHDGVEIMLVDGVGVCVGVKDKGERRRGRERKGWIVGQRIERMRALSRPYTMPLFP